MENGCHAVFVSQDTERKAMGREAENAIKEGVEEGLRLLVLSNAPKHSECFKVKIYPVMLKQNVCYQIEEYRGTQIFHKNCTQGELEGEAVRRLFAGGAFARWRLPPYFLREPC